MTGTCSRCGRVSEVEYGSDGQAYCSACAFYGLNKQCFRCRMYLPSTELQTYRGQLVCPYCIQDMRDEDRRISEPAASHPKLEVLQYSETCERCGRDLEGRVYIWNGRRLCKSCLNDEKDTWGLASGGPMGPAQRIKVDTVHQAQKKSIIERAIGDVLALMGIRKKPISEVIIYQPRMKTEITAAKPMAEKSFVSPAPIHSEGKAKPPAIEVEGIMNPENMKTRPQLPPALEAEGKPEKASIRPGGPRMEKPGDIVPAPQQPGQKIKSVPKRGKKKKQ